MSSVGKPHAEAISSQSSAFGKAPDLELPLSSQEKYKMTPNNKLPYNPNNEKSSFKDTTRRGKGEAGSIPRIKMLIAAGAVAGMLGGWAIIAGQGASTQAQAAGDQASVAALVTQSPTITATPSATATLQALTATATPQATSSPTAQATATTAESTTTSTAKATATTAQATATQVPATATPKATSTPEATSTPQPAATAKPAATATPRTTTRTKSSR